MLDKIAVYFTSTVGMGLAVVTVALAAGLAAQTVRVSSWQRDYEKVVKDAKDDQAKLALDASVWKQKASTWQQQAVAQIEATKKAEVESKKLAGALAEISAKYEKKRQSDTAAIAAIYSHKPVGSDCVEAIKQVQDLTLERRAP